jgi:tight adherence protein B
VAVLYPIAVFTFLAIFCVLVAVYLGVSGMQSSPKSELKRRLRAMSRQGSRELPPELRSEITRETAQADRILARFPLTRNLDSKLDHAGLELTASAFALGTAALALFSSALVLYLGKSVLLGLLTALATPLLAGGLLRFKAMQRAEKFTELFPDALTMIARSLRAGHSFNTAVQLVGQEIANPVGELFKMAYDQQQLGLRISDGLSNINGRLDSLDLRFFTTVVSIHSEAGGNLSEILDKLAVTIRERLRIRRQVRVYTAQGRMSGYVLGALPIIAFVAFNILNPSYESALIKEPMGVSILMLAAGMQLIGLLVIRNIIKIKI